MSCDEVIGWVKKHLPGYVKADQAIATGLMANVNIAIRNAEWLETRAETNGYNPYTAVHRVLRHFERAASAEER